MEGFCRGCLIKYNEPMELLQYTEKNRRLFVYSTGLQVKRNDSFTFQLCKDCFLNMKQACKFKKLCRTSDKRFKNYLALKDEGDPVDFCTFLKNSDDTLTFRFPMISANSTPANHKCRDDDNESTCTSIRNFMTDILQGEEMPDTEARIIKEVIEEEADVLDDSLDSQWLQDDMSIDTDFRLDISFSPFSTPLSVNNDRCYTPKKFDEQKEEQVNFYSINSEKQTKILNDFTNAFKNNLNVEELSVFGEEKTVKIENSENNVFETVKEVSPFGIDEIDSIYKSDSDTLKTNKNLKELCSFSIDEIDGIEKSESTIKHNQSLKELCDFSLDDIDSTDQKPESRTIKSLKEISDLSLHDFDEIAKSRSTFKNDQNIKELCAFRIDEIDSIEKSVNNIDMPSLNAFESDKMNIQNFYTPKDVGSIVPIQSNNEMSNGSNNIEALLKDRPCTIDKNLQEALKNTANKEFSLDDLIVSPPEFQAASAASTPTITNILFGEKLQIDTSINPKFGPCIETYNDLQCDIEIFEEFFKNDTKEFDLDDIKRTNVEMNTEDGNVPIANDNGQVDKKEKESKNIGIDTSVKDKDQAINNNDTTVSITEKKEIKHVSSTSDSEMFDLENSYCNLCKKKFKSVKALSIHFVKKHSIKIVKPKQKGSRYYNYSKLCSTCGMEFSSRSIYYTHKKKCGQPDKIFKCERCPEEFKNQRYLDKHTICHAYTYLKNNSGEEYVCTLCGVIMNKRCNFELHMRRHKKNYSLTCKLCGKGFYRKPDLTSHMRQHTGETPHACKFCPRLFTRKDTLARHVQIHLNERIFECDYCGLQCLQKAQLKNHILKQSCRRKYTKAKHNKKMDSAVTDTPNAAIDTPNAAIDTPSVAIDTPIQEQVTVIYAKGDNASIKKQLPFLETDLSN